METTADLRTEREIRREEDTKATAVASKRATAIIAEEAITAEVLFALYGTAHRTALIRHRDIRDVAITMATSKIGSTESKLRSALTNQLYVMLETRVLEHDMGNSVAMITAALERAGADPQLIEVAYGAQAGTVKVRRVPSNEPPKPHIVWSSGASATGAFVGVILFTYEGYDYQFLRTPKKSRRSWRANHHMRSTKNLDTLLKNIQQQFYVPSEVLSASKAELATVEARIRHLDQKLRTSKLRSTKVASGRWMQDPNLYDLMNEVVSGNRERFDYLVRKQQANVRFRAFIQPLIDDRRERKLELTTIIRNEEAL